MQNISNEKHYERIDESAAQEHMNNSMNEFLNCMKEPSLKLTYEDYEHLQQSNNNIKGISASCCMPKVHKNKTPTQLRQVMSTVNTKSHFLGK